MPRGGHVLQRVPSRILVPVLAGNTDPALEIASGEGEGEGEGEMTPDHFLGEIVTANVLQLSENRGNMTCAVNALLTLDAFTGILFAHLANLKRSPFKDDIEFRDVLCHECSEFRIVRDAAFALKHGELTAKKPRLVQRADQVVSYSGAFDQAVHLTCRTRESKYAAVCGREPFLRQTDLLYLR